MSTTVKKDVISVAELRRALASGLVKVTKKYRQQSRQEIADAPATGRLYQRRGGAGFKRFHRASARGETAASDTGNLMRTIEFSQVSDVKTTVEATADYAEILVAIDRKVLADTSDAQNELDLECRRIVNQFLK